MYEERARDKKRAKLLQKIELTKFSCIFFQKKCKLLSVMPINTEKSPEKSDFSLRVEREA